MSIVIHRHFNHVDGTRIRPGTYPDDYADVLRHLPALLEGGFATQEKPARPVREPEPMANVETPVISEPETKTKKK